MRKHLLIQPIRNAGDYRFILENRTYDKIETIDYLMVTCKGHLNIIKFLE